MCFSSFALASLFYFFFSCWAVGRVTDLEFVVERIAVYDYKMLRFPYFSSIPTYNKSPLVLWKAYISGRIYSETGGVADDIKINEISRRAAYYPPSTNHFQFRFLRIISSILWPQYDIHVSPIPWANEWCSLKFYE